MPKRNGKLIIDATQCKGCNICIEFCPQGALAPRKEITKKGVFPPELIDDQKCTRCGICSLYCPDFAIFIAEEIAV